MLFLFRSAPEVEKRIHSKLFRKFWRNRGTKEPAYITVSNQFQLINQLKKLRKLWWHSDDTLRTLWWHQYPIQSNCEEKHWSLFTEVAQWNQVLGLKTKHKLISLKLECLCWSISMSAAPKYRRLAHLLSQHEVFWHHRDPGSKKIRFIFENN